MPGVSVPVKGGFTEAEVYEMFGTLMKKLPIAAYDIVEFNQEYDRGNRTADFVSDWCISSQPLTEKMHDNIVVRKGCRKMICLIICGTLNYFLRQVLS